MKRLLVLLVACLGLVAPDVAHAGNPRNTVALDPSYLGGDGQLHFGQQVNFLYTSRFDGAFIHMECIGSYSGTWDPYIEEHTTATPFTLGPSATWTYGPASCLVILSHPKPNNLSWDATTSIEVSA